MEEEILNKHNSIDNVELCWTKLDKKPKKLTWMISSDNDYLKNKANPDTVEAITDRITNLQYKIN